MEIKAQKEDLLACLDCVKDAAGSSGLNAILSNVLFKSAADTLTMTTTDHEIQMEAKCQITAGADLERLLPVAKLQSILRSLDGGAEVSIKFRKEDATVCAGRAKFKLATSRTEEFARLGETSKMEMLEKVAAADFQKALRKVYYASGQRSHRMSLNGVFLDRGADGASFVATDGHRLAIQKIAANGSQKTTQHILPRKTVDILIQRLGDAETLKIYANDRVVKFNTDKFELTSNVIDDVYPDYRAVIPRGNDIVALVEREPLLAVMRRVAAVAERGDAVAFSFAKGRVDVECLNKDSDSLNDWLEAKCELAEALKIRFNINFIMDVLNAMDAPVIEVQLKDSNSSALIKAPEDDSFNYVLMPVFD
jgi:DNA polymerase-3 subunit beta